MQTKPPNDGPSFRLTADAARILRPLLLRGATTNAAFADLSLDHYLRLAPLAAVFGETIDGNEAKLALYAMRPPPAASGGELAEIANAFLLRATGNGEVASLQAALRVLQSDASPAALARRNAIAARLVAADPEARAMLDSALLAPLSTRDRRLYVATLRAYCETNVTLPSPATRSTLSELDLADVESLAKASRVAFNVGGIDDFSTTVRALQHVLPREIVRDEVLRALHAGQPLNDEALSLWPRCAGDRRLFEQIRPHWSLAARLSAPCLPTAAAILPLFSGSGLSEDWFAVVAELCQLPVAADAREGFALLQRVAEAGLDWVAVHVIVATEPAKAVESLRALVRLRPSDEQLRLALQASSAGNDVALAMELIEVTTQLRGRTVWRLSEVVAAWIHWAAADVDVRRDLPGLMLLGRSSHANELSRFARGHGLTPATATPATLREALVSTMRTNGLPSYTLIECICSLDWASAKPVLEVASSLAQREAKAGAVWDVRLEPLHRLADLHAQMRHASPPKDLATRAMWRLQRAGNLKERSAALTEALNARPRGYPLLLNDPVFTPLLSEVVAAARPDLGVDATLLLTNAMAEGVARAVEVHERSLPRLFPTKDEIDGFHQLGVDTFGSRVDDLKKRGLFPATVSSFTIVTHTNEKNEQVQSAVFPDLRTGLMAMTALLADERRRAAADARALFPDQSPTAEQLDFFTLLYFNCGAGAGRRFMQRMGLSMAGAPYPRARPDHNRDAHFNAVERLASLRLLRSLKLFE